jgi:hypothetical protein
MKDNPVALWSALFAFFGSLIAIGIFDVFNPDQWVEYVGAILVAGITGGSVYAKQMLDDARADKEEQKSAMTTYKKD